MAAGWLLSMNCCTLLLQVCAGRMFCCASFTSVCLLPLHTVPVHILQNTTPVCAISTQLVPQFQFYFNSLLNQYLNVFLFVLTECLFFIIKTYGMFIHKLLFKFWFLFLCVKRKIFFSCLTSVSYCFFSVLFCYKLTFSLLLYQRF